MIARHPLRRGFDWTFRSRETGRITIGQSPNRWQKIFQATTLVGTLLPRSRFRTAAGTVAVGALAVWGVEELVRGVNPFRRIAGLVALGGIAYLALREK